MLGSPVCGSVWRFPPVGGRSKTLRNKTLVLVLTLLLPPVWGKASSWTTKWMCPASPPQGSSRTIESLESSSYNRSVAAVCFMLCRRCVPCSCIASPLAIFESRCLRMMPHSSPTPRAHRRAVLCSRREDVQPRKCHQTNNTTGRAPVRIFEQGATPGAYTVSPVGLRYWIPYDSNGRGECFRRNGRGCD